MSDLLDLCISSPLKERIEFATSYIAVDRYRKIKVVSYSDVILQVFLEFSEDAVELGSSNLYRIASGVWKCEEITTAMKYMRVRVVNQSGKPNEKLIVKVTPIKLNELYVAPAVAAQPVAQPVQQAALVTSPSLQSVAAPPVVPSVVAAPVDISKVDPVDDEANEQPESVEEKKKRFKSPFSLRRASSKVKSVKDYRMPDLVPKGCILIGGNNGSIQAMPLGNPGEILMINDQGVPEWVKLSVPSYKPLPSIPCPTSLPPPLAKSNSSGSAAQPSVAFDFSK